MVFEIEASPLFASQIDKNIITNKTMKRIVNVQKNFSQINMNSMKGISDILTLYNSVRFMYCDGKIEIKYRKDKKNVEFNMEKFMELQKTVNMMEKNFDELKESMKILQKTTFEESGNMSELV